LAYLSQTSAIENPSLRYSKKAVQVHSVPRSGSSNHSGKYYIDFVLISFPVVKELWISLKIWRSYQCTLTALSKCFNLTLWQIQISKRGQHWLDNHYLHSQKIYTVSQKTWCQVFFCIFRECTYICSMSKVRDCPPWICNWFKYTFPKCNISATLFHLAITQWWLFIISSSQLSRPIVWLP